MSGTILSSYKDFAEGTTPAYVQSPTNWVNAAGKRRYHWMRMFDEKKSIGGGEDIRTSIVFQDNGSYENYLPGANHSWKNPQRLKYVVTPWRFALAHKSWTDQEILLNDKIKYGSDQVIAETFVSINYEKDMLAMTAIANGVETDMFREPDSARMTDADSLDPLPYSFFAWVNEETDGLYDGFTTVGGITPTNSDIDGQFTPQQATYANNTQDDIGNPVAGLDDLFMLCDFEQPPTLSEYFNDPVLNKQRILTSRLGRKQMKMLIRGGTDDYAAAGAQDPGVPNPMMHGIPIEYVSEFDTAAIYAGDSSTRVTESAATVTLAGARYYLWNGNYLYPTCHESRFLETDAASRHHNVPDTWVVPTYMWWNTHCSSRKHQGVLSPSGTI